jgi:uncharacterized protein YjbI with pentapeptide repeats
MPERPPSIVVRKLSQAEVDAICFRHDRLWQAKSGGARAIFSHCDLSGLKLRDRNLVEADFTGAILFETDLSGSRLDHASFFGADLQGARLLEASLKRADLRGACLRGADLTGADLFEADLREGSIALADRDEGLKVQSHTDRLTDASGVNMSRANLQRTRMSGMVAVKADFSDAVMKDVKLVRANLKQANLSGADLAGADLSGADLAGANLKDAVLMGAKTRGWNVSEANMTGVLTDPPPATADLINPYAALLAAHAQWCETGGKAGQPSTFDNADLRSLGAIRGLNLTALSARGAVFYGLDMSGVQLQGAHLEGADLRCCNLRRADLRGARLRGAKLSLADLRDVQLGPILITAERVLPADLREITAKKTDFSGADLTRCNFRNADLERANFTAAHARDVDLTDAVLVGIQGLRLFD